MLSTSELGVEIVVEQLAETKITVNVQSLLSLFTPLRMA